MQFRIEQRFRLPLAIVEDAFLDPAFIAETGSLPGLGQAELLTLDSSPPSSGDVHLRIRYHFAGNLSSAVRAVVDPDRLSWVQDETYDRGSHRSSFRIVPDHYAEMLKASGTMRLSAAGPDRTTRLAIGEVRVSLPLVGGRVERAIISGLEAHAAAQTDLLHVWAGQGHSSPT